MAQNEMQPTRFQQFLTKLFGIEGAAPAPILGADVQPVVDINRMDAHENLYPRGEIRYGGSLALAGVAAEYFYAALYNPTGSGQIVTVEHVWCAAPNNGVQWDIGEFLSTKWASLAGRSYDAMDQRRAQNAIGMPGACILRTGTDPATGGVVNIVGRMQVPAYFESHLFPGYVILPGMYFGVFCASVNITVTGGIWWRERPVLHGELT